VEHHAALPWREIGAFMAILGQQEGVSALALRFVLGFDLGDYRQNWPGSAGAAHTTNLALFGQWNRTHA
jgi:hypothetical protein